MVIHIDRRFFFDTVLEALFKGTLSGPQVEGMTAILNFWEERMADADPRWLAYILATAFHETAYTMQPVRETLAGSDEKAIEILDRAYAAGKLSWVKTVYWLPDEDGKSWLGRGLVQLTHRVNYEKMALATGIDLLSRPERAMEMAVAIDILFIGMQTGAFTGRRLEQYFSENKEDWTGARRIINGRDRAELVAGYGRRYLAAIQKARAA
jgi:hypothetical protein